MREPDKANEVNKVNDANDAQTAGPPPGGRMRLTWWVLAWVALGLLGLAWACWVAVLMMIPV